jgi:hypothetical protein
VLQSQKEHQRWLRDQKVRAAIGFIGATGDLHDHRRHPPASPDPSAERDAWTRIQNGRSALYLLCTTGTVEAAEALITGVRRTPPTADCGPRDDETIAYCEILSDDFDLNFARDWVSATTVAGNSCDVRVGYMRDEPRGY